MQRFIKAEPVSEDGLSDAQVSQWRESGFTFVGGLLPPTLIVDLKAAALDKFPAPGTAASASIASFGSDGALNFPSRLTVFNDVVLHEDLLTAVARLLGVPVQELRLTQADLWPKYGRHEKLGIQDNADQRMHVDYPNHTLTHPPAWDDPEAVELILYLNGIDESGGYTAVVPREGPDDPSYRWPIVDSPGIGDLQYINDREAAEDYFATERPALAAWRKSLYAKEKHTFFDQGDIIFYRHDTWHRGTPLKPGSLRLVMNLTFRKASAEWISTLHVGWAWKAYSDDKFLERLVAGSSLAQRAVLGFPQPGSSYWTPETLDAVEARYGMFGLDMTPYRANDN
jgi:hypothetical protein